MPANSDHLILRIEGLERRNRFLTATMTLLCFGGLAMLLVTSARAKERVVEGEVFALKDAKGKPRGGLRVNESGAAELTLFSGRGQGAILITADPSGRQVVGFVSEKGAPRATLSLDPEGAVQLGLSDAAGKPRAALGLVKGEVATLTVAGLGGSNATLAALPNGEAGLVLSGRDGAPRVAVSIEANGSPSLKLLKDGKALFAKP